MYIYVDIDNFFLNFILHYLPIKINFILRKLFHSAQVKESSKRERERAEYYAFPVTCTDTHTRTYKLYRLFFLYKSMEVTGPSSSSCIASIVIAHFC